MGLPPWEGHGSTSRFIPLFIHGSSHQHYHDNYHLCCSDFLSNLWVSTWSFVQRIKPFFGAVVDWTADWIFLPVTIYIHICRLCEFPLSRIVSLISSVLLARLSRAGKIMTGWSVIYSRTGKQKARRKKTYTRAFIPCVSWLPLFYTEAEINPYKNG